MTLTRSAVYVAVDASRIRILVHVCTTPTADPVVSSAVEANAPKIGDLATALTTYNVDRAGIAVIENAASVIRPLVTVLRILIVTLASNVVMGNASIVRLLVPVRTPSIVTKESGAVTANVSTKRLHVPVGPMTSVTCIS